MALVVDNKKPFYSSTETSLRLGIFAAHAISAVFMLLKAYRILGDDCANNVFLSSRSVVPSDPYLIAVKPHAYPLQLVRIKNMTSCVNDTSWNKGWCHFSNLPFMVDYIDDRDSFVLGSSWNIIVLVMMFEWITASYALLYFDPFDNWIKYESLWWGLHPIAVIATLWNGVMCILIWVSEEKLNIPPNNLFIYTAILIGTIVLQNYLSLNRDTKEEKIDEKVSVGPENQALVSELRFDTFLRQRKPLKTNYGYQLLQPLSTGKDFHEPHFIAAIERSNYGVVPRYLEYMVTAPILFVGLYVNSIPYDLTWKLQIMFISIFVCNGLGIALNQAVMLISTDPKADNMDRFNKAANYFFIASWLSLIVAFYLFVWSLRDFLIETTVDAMPDWVRSLI